MSSIRFELNGEGVRELMKSPEMQEVLRGHAQNKAAEAGDGYESGVHIGQKRAYANIYPGTREAYYDNLDNNTLEKVIRA